MRGGFFIFAMYSQKIDDQFLADFAKVLNIELTVAQVNAIKLILFECDFYGITDARMVAYILGTCYHECRFMSIREIRAMPGTAVWKMQNRYWHTGFFGRGYCQLTWEKNYRKFTPIVGVDLVANPDAALIPKIGATILVYGMYKGMFSGVGLTKYFPPPPAQPKWLGARRIVNGTFQADLVAKAAKKILPLLENTTA